MKLQTQKSQNSNNAGLGKQPKMIGPYQVGEVVGRGACGKVFKGLNFQTGQLVAIKQIKINNFKEEQKSALQMEINLLKKLEHPNIVKYIDSLYTEHYLNIILEYVENGSLDSLIKKFGKFPEHLVAIYVQQVLQGLDYLHTQGVIHRDIKGGNILTTKDGIVKLADFGVATKLTDSEKSNSAVGTPYWMAPEVIEMSGQVTSACDIWSLGCTVIELLTTNPPFSNLHPCTAMIKIVQEGMPPLPESISEELKDFLNKSFEKDPFKRIDAKSLLEHQWLKKYDKNLFQKIISNSNQLPEVVSNTIKLHINQADKQNYYNSIYVQSQQTHSASQLSSQHTKNSLSEVVIQRKESNIDKQNAQPIEPKTEISSNIALQQQKSKQQQQISQKKNQNQSQQQPQRKETTQQSDDEDGEIGEFAEEINDMNDVPIERPKCLSQFNFNNNFSDKQLNTIASSQMMPPDKVKKMHRQFQVQQDAQSDSQGSYQNKLNTTEILNKKSSGLTNNEQMILHTQQFELSTENIEDMREGYSNISMKHSSSNHQKSMVINQRQGLTQNQSQLISDDQSNRYQKQSSFQQVQLKQGNNQVPQINPSMTSGNLSQPTFSLSGFNSQTRETPSQRQNLKSQDKSAGPGSGDGAALIRHANTTSNPAIIQSQIGIPQSQPQKQVFDVQGNRKVYYLTKKNQKQLQEQQTQSQQILGHHELSHSYAGSGGNPNDESQLSLSNGGTQRQKRLEPSRNKKQQPQQEEQELLQQQQYQQQQREMMLRYHQQAVQSQQLSGGNLQVPQYFKAKSNDIMLTQSSPHANNQAQFFLPPGQNMHQHHNTTAIHYQSSKNFQNQYNFQFQDQQLLSEAELNQPPQNYGSRIQLNRNIQHQHNYTQMPNQMFMMQHQYSNQDPQHQQLVIDQRNLSPMSSQNLQRKKGNLMMERLISSKNYNSGSNFSVQPSFTNVVANLHDCDNEQLYDDGALTEAFQQQQLLQQQDSDYTVPPQLQKPYMFGNSADFNVAQRQQQNIYHQRIGSSYSQMNIYQNNQETQNQIQQQIYPAQNIEEHIKRTQLSEQKLGRPHLTQFYGNNYPFHIQHKSVISNFQGSNGSPKNLQTKLAQPHQPTNNVQSNPVDSSFENYFETISNNAFQTTDNNEHYIESNGPMINMQDLMNVRESYSKKLAEEEFSAENPSDERKFGFMMMLAMGGNGQSEQQIDNYMRRMQGRAHNRNLGGQGTNVGGASQQPQFQSIGSGRSNYSVSQQRQFDNILLQQLLEESLQYVASIKQNLNQIDNQDQVVEIGADGSSQQQLLQQQQQQHQTQIDTEENKIESERNLLSAESQLLLNIRKLTQLLKDFGNEQFKDSVVKNLGYTTLITLLRKSDEVAYPSLQLINQICENSVKHQELMCLCGLIPFLIKFGSSFYPREISIEVAYFIGQIYQCSSQALQMLISNQGLQILIDFLDFNYDENKDLVMLAIDSFLVLYDEQSNIQIPHDDLSILLCRMGLIENVAVVIPKLIHNIETSIVLNEHSQAEKYLEKAFDVLQQMLNSGSQEVKARFCIEKVIKVNFVLIIQNTINEPSPFTLMIIKRFIKLLQLDLEKNEIVKLLVEMLQFFMQDIQHIQLQLIYDSLKLINVLCKLSTSRTEQAAMASLLAPIKKLAEYLATKNDISRSKKGKLLKYMLSIIQEFIVASTVTRQLLIGYQIQGLLISIIQQQQQQYTNSGSQNNQNNSKDQTINAKILDLFVLWLQTDSSQIEQFLAKRQTLEIFINIFLISPRTKVFLYVFNAINRMVQRSSLIARSFTQNSHLIEKLSTQLVQIDQAFTSAASGLDDGTNRKGHHNKNSSSARSFNNLMQIGMSQANIKTIEGLQQQQNSKKSQQAQIMKELMEIFQNLCQKSETGSSNFIDKNNLGRVFQKVLQTSEQSNLVILQQIAQNIISQYQDESKKSQSNQPLLQDQISLAQKFQGLQQQQMIIRQQNLSGVNQPTGTGTHSTRSKSPLYQ